MEQTMAQSTGADARDASSIRAERDDPLGGRAARAGRGARGPRVGLPLVLMLVGLSLFGASCDGGPATESPIADQGVDAMVEPAWTPPPLPDAVVGEAWAALRGAPDALTVDERYGPLADGWPDWRQVFVDPTASEPGDGSEAAPFRTIAEALGEGDVIVRIAAGVHDAVSVSGHSAIITGPGAATTVLRADAGVVVAVDGADAFILRGVTIQGGDRGLFVEGGSRVELSGVRLTGAAFGVGLDGVGLTEVRDSLVDDMSDQHITVVDGMLGIERSWIGGGAGLGLLASTRDPGEIDCEGRAGPCPFRTLVHLADSAIVGVGRRGIEADRSLLRLNHTVVGVVASDAQGGTAGLLAWQSFIVATDGSAVTDVDGPAARLVSCRGMMDDVTVARSVGGIEIERGCPVGTGPGCDELRALPESAYVDGLDWDPLLVAAGWPIEAFPGSPWTPPLDWFPGSPWRPVNEAIPYALRDDVPLEDQSPERGLLTWARLELRGVNAEANQDFAIRAADHAIAIRGGRVHSTLGAASQAVRLVQRTSLPIHLPGASVAAFSEISDLLVEDNAGTGMSAYRVALFCRDNGEGPACSRPLDPRGAMETRLFPGARVLIDGVRVASNRLRGVSLIDSVASVSNAVIDGNLGAGIWSTGAIATLTDNQITNTLMAELPGRDGPINVGDGLVLEGSERWLRYSADALTINGNQIRGSARAGLLVIRDQQPIEGRIEVSMGEISENEVNAAEIGGLGDLEVGGIELQRFSADELPPPVCESCEAP